ncbi:MAG: TSUP family transporter [Treponema sp.]|nr:TSUP family transporter [Treponema sp.]
MVQIPGFLFIACLASTIGAISGIGGGIIIKPVLDAFSGQRPAEINFLSGSTVLAMSLVSLLRSRNSGVRLEQGRGTAIAGGAALGGAAGKLIFSAALRFFSRAAVVGIVQSLILIVLALLVLLYLKKKKTIRPLNIHNIPFCLLTGLLLGMVSAFLGIGGGPINIMVISFFLSMDSKTTALHSLYAVFLSQAAGFLLVFAEGSVPPVNPVLVAAMIAGGISGGLIGSRIVKLISNDQVDGLFSVVLWLVILLSAYNTVRLAAFR